MKKIRKTLFTLLRLLLQQVLYFRLPDAQAMARPEETRAKTRLLR